jgi:hypothetical protein
LVEKFSRDQFFYPENEGGATPTPSSFDEGRLVHVVEAFQVGHRVRRFVHSAVVLVNLGADSIHLQNGDCVRKNYAWEKIPIRKNKDKARVLAEKEKPNKVDIEAYVETIKYHVSIFFRIIYM